MLSESETKTLVTGTPILAHRFDIVKVLGQGAAGAVFLARDLSSSGDFVALKVLTNSAAFDENTRQRFIEEFRACQKIQHENVVRSYEYIELDDGVAFTMEFVEGYDLSKLIYKRKYGWDEIDSILQQILEALGELHRNNIVHRDIKLENVLITSTGIVKLVDLGLIRKMDQDGLTRTGVLLGTAQYMPPEYVNNGIYDQRSDLYAVGLLLYEVLSGRRRLQKMHGRDALEYLVSTGFKVERIQDSPLGEIPNKYHLILQRALEPRPKKRYQTAAEMKADFTLPIRPVANNPIGSLKKHENYGSSSEWFSTRTLLGAFAILVIGVMVGVPIRASLSKSAGYGNYSGDLIGEDGSVREVRAALSQNGTFIVLGLPGCKSGFVNPTTNEVTCARGGVRVRLASESSGSLSGEISDQMTSINYRIRLKLEP